MGLALHQHIGFCVRGAHYEWNARGQSKNEA